MFLGVADVRGAFPQSGSLEHDGLTRTFIYYEPNDLPAEPVPLVFVLHGGGQNAFVTMAGTHEGKWNDLADEEKFIVIYPEGRPDPVSTNEYHWNDCRADVTDPDTLSTEDDVGFVIELINWASSNFDIDANRIYAAGTSNGGLMAYRLAMELGDQIAAVAAIIANMAAESECATPTVPISVLIMNGTDDSLMPDDGGCVSVCPSGKGTVESTQDSVDFWVNLNSTDTTPSVQSFPDIETNDHSTVTMHTYGSGLAGTEVVYYRVDGGGHQVPGPTQPSGDPPSLGWKNQDIFAAEEIWTFFSRHVNDTIPPSTPTDLAIAPP